MQNSGERDHARHVTRKEKNRKTQNILEWEHNINKPDQLVRQVEEHQECRQIVHSAANARTEDG